MTVTDVSRRREKIEVIFDQSQRARRQANMELGLVINNVVRNFSSMGDFKEKKLSLRREWNL